MQFDKRGVVAAVLSFVYPGLGHAYLRAWVRAVAWFALALMTAAVLIPEAAFETFRQGGFDAMLSYRFPLQVTIGLVVVRLLNIVDAYLLAVRRSMPAGAPDEEPNCPVCGKELDRDLDFCPWCTTRIEWVDPGETQSTSR